jgi:dTDP-4-dehydrorhamnose reductase
MLGSMVLDVFAGDPEFRLIATVRDEGAAAAGRRSHPDVEWRLLDAEAASDGEIAAAIDSAEWVVNCIGVIKPYIHDDHPAEIERAVRVNALFPYRLGRVAAADGAHVLQIATDCVYSGVKGSYVESDPHDAFDVYGKTKSLGEPFLPNVRSLRCSIIGPEKKSFVSLLEWFLRQPAGARVNGFTNHRWNGVTTYHFGRLCRGIVAGGIELPRLQHVVPSGVVSKEEMLRGFAASYGRADIGIEPVEAKTVIDRTLATGDAELNRALWRVAGYAEPPTVPQMIEELARFQGKEAEW